MDGTTPSKSYQETMSNLISEACKAEELFDIDELEEYAKQYPIVIPHEK
jgi:hypothetical protein